MYQKNHKILVIDLAFIGDVVLVTPVLRSLKQQYPDGEITLMTVPGTASVAAMLPYVNHVITYDKRGVDKGLLGMWCLGKRLRQEKFDLAVCMNFAVRGAMVAWLAGIPRRAGYDIQHGRWFLNRITSAKRNGIKHERLNHLEVLRALNIEPAKDTTLGLCIPSEAQASVRQKVNLTVVEKPKLAVCPYGSYERKNLPLELLVPVLKALKKDYHLYLIGDKGAKQNFARLGESCGLDKTQLLPGTLNLQELAAFLRMVDGLLTVDTGPQHMAQAVACPTVAVFGPTDPCVWGPSSEKDVVIYRAESCSPCWGKGSCDRAKCIQDIDVAEIVEAVKSRIQP